MPYSAKAVANEFLELAKKDSKQLTPMQLQKLVYFAYGWYLAITGKRLINERVEAWEWGPVVPSLYSEFKRFGSDPITDLAREAAFQGLTATLRPYRVKSGNNIEDGEALQIIRRVWEIYGKYSASQLSTMTHEPNSPWAQTPDKDIRGTDIPDNLIASYFRRLATTNEQRVVK
jgi:uncharacterized phage-associated protein